MDETANKGRIKVLFLCTGNSCRSQMAEGWANALIHDGIESYSAGIETQELNINAVRVMAEAGVDISRQQSKHVSQLERIAFNYVITVCDNADENCPIFPGNTRVIHRSFDDPPKLAENEKSEEDTLRHYRRVRDQIKEFVKDLPQLLDNEKDNLS